MTGLKHYEKEEENYVERYTCWGGVDRNGKDQENSNKVHVAHPTFITATFSVWAVTLFYCLSFLSVLALLVHELNQLNCAGCGLVFVVQRIGMVGHKFSASDDSAIRYTKTKIKGLINSPHSTCLANFWLKMSQILSGEMFKNKVQPYFSSNLGHLVHSFKL